MDWTSIVVGALLALVAAVFGWKTLKASKGSQEALSEPDPNTVQAHEAAKAKHREQDQEALVAIEVERDERLQKVAEGKVSAEDVQEVRDDLKKALEDFKRGR